MNATDDDWFAEDALPTHYTAKGTVCSASGGVPTDLGGCPFGCDFAPHYSNDGHQGCADEAPIGQRRAARDAAAQAVTRGVCTCMPENLGDTVAHAPTCATRARVVQ